METPLISVQDIDRLLRLSPVRLADTRWKLGDPSYGKQAFRTGHLPGAVHLDMDEALSAAPGGPAGRHPLPDAEAFAETMSAAGVDDETLVVAYDAGDGMGAARLWWLLRHFGHDGVVILDGGLPAWTSAGRELEAGRGKSRARRTFAAQPRQGDTINTEELRHSLASKSVVLLDARGPERWRGDTEPLDAKAGHIPGAINAPATANMRHGRLLSTTELRAHYESMGIHDAANIVASCGSGVSACLDLLALEVAGLPGARLYPASYSGWVAAGLPVETA